MLTSLTVKNFRMLRELKVPKLGRVNLIVGKNNSGKSTILEALRILASGASRSLLEEIVTEHDETIPSIQAPNERRAHPYENFFHGRHFPAGEEDEIYVGDDAQFVRIGHSFYVQEPVPENEGVFRRRRVKAQDAEETARQALLVRTTESPSVIRWIDLPHGIRRRWESEAEPEAAAGYVPTRLLPSSDLADLWDVVALTSAETLIRALRVIEPRVQALAFVKRPTFAKRPTNRSQDRAAVVKLEGEERPIPLNSMGDGMARVLQLVLMLLTSRGGLYLVDEFENGLHYSVQERIWSLLFQLVTELDVQMFAATHSWDCIEAFKTVASRSAESAMLFRVGKSVLQSEAGKTIATVFDSDALAQLTQAQVEVR